MKVLLIIDHAPNYRESFFAELCNYVCLTIIAQPCEPIGLTPPDSRSNYKYIEIQSKTFAGLFWQPKIQKIIKKEKWDIICWDLYLRHINRLLTFIISKSLWTKWVWWGHIFGKNDIRLLNIIRKSFLRKAAGCLVYNEPTAKLLMGEYNVKAVSFNNTQVKKSDFRKGYFLDHPGLNLLFVGRYQKRKKLEILVDLAKKRKDISVRLIGPGMEKLIIPKELEGLCQSKR